MIKGKRTLKIDCINAKWDLDWQEDEHKTILINETCYKLFLIAENSSNITNIIKNFQVFSRDNGKLNIFIEHTIKIGARDSWKFDISATLSGKHAKEGDVITIQATDMENQSLTDCFTIERYNYGENYREYNNIE